MTEFECTLILANKWKKINVIELLEKIERDDNNARNAALKICNQIWLIVNSVDRDLELE